MDSLQETVLKWSIRDCIDQTFLEKQVGTVPMEFSSTNAYQQAFRAPLLEEIRAQLHQAFESITMGLVLPVNITIMNINRRKTHVEKYNKTDLRLKSSPWTRSISASPIKDSEIILLCSDEPKWDSTRNCLVIPVHDTFRCILASVTALSTAIVYLHTTDLHFIMDIRDKKRSWHAVRMGMSLIPAQRIWDALDKVTTPVNRKPPVMPVIQSILQIKQTCPANGVTSLSLPQPPEGARTLKIVDAYCTSRSLNPSQAEVLRSVMAGLLTITPNPHVRLVQGPPGTGKTSMLVTLLAVLGCLHRRTLVSAPTNAAVVEIAKRMMTTFFQVQGGVLQPELFSKYCTEYLQSESTSRSEAVRECSPLELRDVVLVGSPERLKGAVDGTLLMKVFLPYRAHRLLLALQGLTTSVTSLVKFMKDPVEAAMPMRLRRGKCWRKIRDALFWRNAGEFMREAKNELEENSSVLISELPRCQLDERIINAITRICDLMKELVTSMPLEAPPSAVSWFTASETDILMETFAGIDLNGAGRKGISKISTVSSAGAQGMRNIPFECGIVDEASQVVEAETTIITSIKELKQLILVGDHKQLPATVISKVAEKCGYGRSLFDRLQTLQHGCRHLLNIQYRMHPSISLFSNSQFYDGAVKDGPNVLSADYGRSLYPLLPYGAYAFLDCKDGFEVSEKKSWTNPMEVQLVTNLVELLAKACARERSLKTISVGIISPYAMQAQALQKSLKHLDLNGNAIDIQVKSVDGFQGGEKDVIIFSAVRANHRAHGIGFVRDCRRLNVAITRGRYCVWIVGNAKTLTRGAPVWKDLICDAKARNCFRHVQRYEPAY